MVVESTQCERIDAARHEEEKAEGVELRVL
jgi:hypothetical protein